MNMCLNICKNLPVCICM